jgi:hypothetical protein
MSGPLDRARRLWPILRPSATGGALLAVVLLALISLPAAAATVEELRARADSGDVGALARRGSRCPRNYPEGGSHNQQENNLKR